MTNEVDWTKPIQFRDGTPLVLLSDKAPGDRNFVVAPTEGSEKGSVYTRYSNGQSFLDRKKSVRDVINAPVKPVTKYANVYLKSRSLEVYPWAIRRISTLRGRVCVGYYEGDFIDGKLVDIRFVKELD